MPQQKKHGTEYHLEDAVTIFDEIQGNLTMQKLWKSYQKKFSYAEEVSWEIVMDAVRSLYQIILW